MTSSAPTASGSTAGDTHRLSRQAAFRPITVDEVLGVSADFCDRVQSASQSLRRLVPAPGLVLTFESRDSILATLGTIMRTEGMTCRTALQAECDVYNLLMPGPGGLCASLQLQPAGGTWRALQTMLAALPQHVWLVLGRERCAAHFPGPLAPRQHIRFPLDAAEMAALADGSQPAYLVIDHPRAPCEQALSVALRRALTEDLR